jgi:hypothetical protein
MPSMLAAPSRADLQVIDECESDARLTVNALTRSHGQQELVGWATTFTGCPPCSKPKHFSCDRICLP